MPAAARPTWRLQQRGARLSSAGGRDKMRATPPPIFLRPPRRLRMNLITPRVEYTPEDLLTMPDGDQFELVDGRLVERHMGLLADWVSGRLFSRLTAYCDAHPTGWVFPGGEG